MAGEDFLEFLKCGDILLAPSSFCKVQYTLKCNECGEHYSVLESFLMHCFKHLDEDLNSFVGKSEAEEYSDINQLGLNDDLSEVIKQEEIEYMSDAEIETKHEIADEPDLDISVEDGFEDCTEELEIKLNDPLTIIKQQNFINTNSEKSYNGSDISDSENEFLESVDTVKLSSPFVHEFFESALKVTTFISAYKNQPFLWDSNVLSISKSKDRLKHLQNITEELNEKIQVQLTINQVKIIISRLRRDYRKKLADDALSKQQNVNEKSRKKIFPSYFDDLDFLKPFLQIHSLTHFDSLHPNLTPQQTIQILGIYENFPHLWNTNLIENVCRNKRLEALEQMQTVLESVMELKTNQQSLERYICSIHVHVRKQKRSNIKNVASTGEKSEFYKHMTFLLEHVAPVNCDQCNKEFFSPLALRVHKFEHDGLIHLKCSLCNKEYKRVLPYRTHARRHMKDLKSECKECGKKFIRPADLQLHMRIHTGEKPYCCEICGAYFQYINKLKEHKRRHENKHSHKCPYCPKGFFSKGQMDDHITVHTNTRKFSCKICEKTFKTRKNLRNHGFTHEEGRNHPCSICGKPFKNKIAIYHHMKTHRKNEPSEPESNPP